MWFRAALFCVFAILLALASALLGHLIPYQFASKVGAQSVDNILNVLATSMLAVTTFSLTAMVSAYSGATSNITPRAVQLLVDDSTAQNALATFLGSFLFAIVGIIALSTGLYGESGRVILFGGTILIIAIIVVTFLRWIEHITRFGRVNDTIHRVESAAMKAALAMGTSPRFGPRQRREVPDDASRIHHDCIGRITHIDIPALHEVAQDLDGEIVLSALPGTMVDPSRMLAWTKARIDDELVKRLRSAFTIAHDRAFDNDPRFGLVVLSEIASRALSPAVNDPGTAISVIEAGTRVLTAMLTHEPDEDEAPTEDVVVPAFAFPDLLEDLYRPIARDGAGLLEVSIRLQKSLAALATTAPQGASDCAAMARNALDRALKAMSNETDRETITQIHLRYWPAP
ncbi:DUF2254 domain-containing protein [Sphingosinicella microcystinivorans]|nr:DUF2254 domain-containing protein [Sphingosinicella microcystinivorans]